MRDQVDMEGGEGERRKDQEGNGEGKKKGKSTARFSPTPHLC